MTAIHRNPRWNSLVLIQKQPKALRGVEAGSVHRLPVLQGLHIPGMVLVGATAANAAEARKVLAAVWACFRQHALRQSSDQT